MEDEITDSDYTAVGAWVSVAYGEYLRLPELDPARRNILEDWIKVGAWTEIGLPMMYHICSGNRDVFLDLTAQDADDVLVLYEEFQRSITKVIDNEQLD